MGRENERERERETDRQTDRQKEEQTERDILFSVTMSSSRHVKIVRPLYKDAERESDFNLLW